MKSLFTLFVIVLAYSTVTYAQWTTSSSGNVILANTNINVGIGNYANINNPIDKLTIGGNMSLYPINGSPKLV